MRIIRVLSKPKESNNMSDQKTETTLRALVLGSGFAGEGHTLALQDAGVEVVGMAGRTRHVVEAMAASLGIPNVYTDWRAAMDELKPDIVAVGTPGGAHYEPVMHALDLGCHIYCDKPLAATAAQAGEMADKAAAMGVKTAYAASFRYQPYCLHARELITVGAIGEPLEIECISHYDLDPLIPFGWSHRAELGGGRLNNNFTHKLAIVLHMLDGVPVMVQGEARDDLGRAPIIDGVHDFRTRGELAPASADDPEIVWGETNVEWSYTVLAHVESPRAARPVSALFRHGGLQPRFEADYVAIYGTEGTIHIGGSYAQGPLHLRQGRGDWQELPLPSHIVSALPAAEEEALRNWTQLAREFVADIRGQGNSGYLTFAEGYRFQEVIEAIRCREIYEAGSAS
jgi:predicted dehydrogenase